MSTPVNLAPYFSLTGILTDGTTLPGDTGLDVGGYTYSSNLIGSGLTFAGVPFVFGAPNVASAVTNTTIPLPVGQYSVLAMLGTGLNGNRPSNSVVVNYTDGSQDTFPQSFSDWFTPQSYPGEQIALPTAYRDNTDGTINHPGPFNLYFYSFVLQQNKMVSSVQLPTIVRVIFLAITLLPPVNLDTVLSPQLTTYGQDYII